jgi:predicted acetyltransferase
MKNFELKETSLDLVPAICEFRDEMTAHGEKVWDGYYPTLNEDSKAYDGDFVPETLLWAMHAGKALGRIALRHYLEGNLHQFGGQIGYEVRPSARKQGIATTMLKEVLLMPKSREIGKLLLTCAPDNIASNKTILSNAGILTQTIFIDFLNAKRNHYWIDLT